MYLKQIEINILKKVPTYVYNITSILTQFTPIIKSDVAQNK